MADANTIKPVAWVSKKRLAGLGQPGQQLPVDLYTEDKSEHFECVPLYIAPPELRVELERMESIHRTEIADMAERFRAVNVERAMAQLASALPPAPVTQVTGTPSANSWHTACVQLLFPHTETYKLFYQIKELAQKIESEGSAPADQAGAWHWWAGSSEEWFEVGPEATREAIIQAATNDSLGENDDDGSWKLSFHIVEARQDPLRIADWLDLDALIERAEDNVADSDRVASEYDDGPWFDCSPEQEKDLRQRLARACDEWQSAHGLAFKTATFSHTRNSEHIVVDSAIEEPSNG